MRQKIVIVLILLSLFAPVFATKEGLVVTYTTDQNLRLELTSQSVRYQLKIEKAKDGKFLVKAPPFLQADISQILHIGELQPQGLFSRLLDPMKGDFATRGFIKGTNVSKNFIPSLEPKISGFDLVGENIELITLSPLLNANSPTGIGAILGNERAYAAVLTASQNSLLVQRNIKSFQVNWKELGYGQHMFFTLVGATWTGKLGTVGLKTGVFLQGAFDTRLGGGNTSAVAVEADVDKAQLKYERKLGGVGVKLKTLEENANAQVKTTLRFTLKGSQEGLKLFGEHKTITYSEPIYGGTSQERTVLYTVGFGAKYFEIKSENSTVYEADRGKTSYTTLTAKTDFKDIDVELSTQIYRPLGKPSELHNTSFLLKDEHCNFEIKNKKVKLKLSWTLPIAKAELELSINQDRCLTARMTF